jgi:glucose-1-phosphate adenylyltransferase
MDIRQMIAFHVDREAEATVACIPVPKHEARDFGVIEVDPSGKIVGFHEKVANPPSMPGNPDMCLASMGNYLFNTTSAMAELSRDAGTEESKHDFGHDILPRMVRNGQAVYGYDFATNRVPGEEGPGAGYWRDVGTIEAYWQALMDLIEIHPQFNLYNTRWPIRTGVTHDPPAKFVFRDETNARVGIATDSLVSHGCIISGGRIHRSVLSVGCRINSFSEVEESVLFENVRIGRHARLRRCIIDKDVEIPQGAEIGFNHEQDRRRFHVTEGGLVVIPKRAKVEENGG